MSACNGSSTEGSVIIRCIPASVIAGGQLGSFVLIRLRQRMIVQCHYHQSGSLARFSLIGIAKPTQYGTSRFSRQREMLADCVSVPGVGRGSLLTLGIRSSAHSLVSSVRSAARKDLNASV